MDPPPHTTSVHAIHSKHTQPHTTQTPNENNHTATYPGTATNTGVSTDASTRSFLRLSLLSALALLAAGPAARLLHERLVDVRNHTATRNGRLDQSVQLLVTPDRQLQMPRRDTLHFEIFGRIAGEFEHLSGKVLENGGRVDGGGGAHTAGGTHAGLEQTVQTPYGELQTGAGTPRQRSLLALARTANLALGADLPADLPANLATLATNFATLPADGSDLRHTAHGVD
mmetsp:Transcript_18701/g.53581  ORF Transcript_18701/g.53581 Transcript_18701/m.53581 type:complete len:228 (+) Transcript_18701:2615-3298(+)